ncbi:hypothetical protein Y032_0602g519 [Ancylostoma ceylanicum]|uniref:Uncharacterized protein n=1 Tax=Ancylostoma ceylanicum TaxID=53326 RepID=A0A016WNS9_9BILA|nr:hypothetical protein Y032_0602g519 [Ancylostoma ceylanicum]
MAYVPSSDVPSAFLISTDADAVLLDLLGTFVLLDGGAEKVSFTKHVRQIDANVISAPTRAALTNAVELNKGTVVPLVGNIPNVKSAGSEDSVASLLKCIEKASDGRPAITPTRFHPKYEPIMISKSLRTGRLELIVLAGEAKEIEALQKAVESGDENIIEKVASNNGTISVLVWFPAKSSDPIKRVLHTGTAPLSRIITALEKAKSLPYLHSPVVSAANAYKEVPAPKAVNTKTTLTSRTAPTKPVNNTTAKVAAARRPGAPAAPHPPSSRPATTTTTSARSAPSSVKPSPARPAAAAATRTRPLGTTTAAKPAAAANRTSTLATAKKTNNHEAPIQKTTVGPLKGAAMSRASAAVGKAVGAVTGKTTDNGKPSGNVPPPQEKPSAPAPAVACPDAPPAAPDAASPASDTTPSAPPPPPEEMKEPASTPVEPTPPLDDSVVCLDDVVPDISIDAPQDPASSDLRPPVELVVIPPTPEPRPNSARSSIDGAPTSPVAPQKPEEEKDNEKDQPVLVATDDDQKTTSDVPSPATTTDPAPLPDHDSTSGHDVQPTPEQPQHDGDSISKEGSSDHPAPDHPVPTAPERTPSPEPDHASAPKYAGPVPDHSLEPTHDEPHPEHTSEPQDKPADIPATEPKGPAPQHDDNELPIAGGEIPGHDPGSPTHKHDSSPVTPVEREVTPAEPFVPPVIRRPSPSPEIVLEGDVPEEFKVLIHRFHLLPTPFLLLSIRWAVVRCSSSILSLYVVVVELIILLSKYPLLLQAAHVPQEVGENGLLDDLEEPPKLMKISMDTDDLKKAPEKGATAVADQLAQCLDSLSLNTTHSEKDSSDLTSPEGQAEVARKISQQMIDEASTPFTSALASTLYEGAESAKKVASSALDDLVDLANTVSETVVDGVKEAADQVNDKMKAMQTRSSIVENDGGEERPIKYEETDPIIDTVLETVANDSDRVDHAMSNGGPGIQAKENGKKEHEVDEEGFRVAADSHDMRLYLPPPSAARGRAAAHPHLSRPLFFELATVPHFNGKCSLPDEQSAIEYFTNVRSANYILHSDDVSRAVLDGWLTAKKHWLNNGGITFICLHMAFMKLQLDYFVSGQKTRVIPTRHHSALQAFVTENAAQLEEYGLVMNSSLEHNTISINTEEGREDYHMIKIEL